MEKAFTLEEVQEAIDLAIGGAEYAKAYRTFKHALEDAHSTLTLDDINELIATAEKEFEENHSCTCNDCLAQKAEATPPSAMN